MKVAVVSMGPDMGSQVAYQFARAPFFIFYDSESGKHEAVENPLVYAPGGAGVQAAQMLAERGVSILIMGGVPGPNASMVLGPAGIKVITGYNGSVKDAIDDLNSGKIKPSSEGLRGGFEGVMPGPVPPPIYPTYNTPPPLYTPSTEPEDEVRYLQDRIEAIERRLEEIDKRLQEKG